jgi:hypothetical protein
MMEGARSKNEENETPTRKMTGLSPLENKKAIGSWPSSRLLELAEGHPGDLELLAFILSELSRRDVAIAQSAARRVTQLLNRAETGGSQSEATLAGERDTRVEHLSARLEAMEARVREAEMRASAAERALATEALPARGNGLLRRVHLAETAPVWLVEAARRAFRLRFHPDRFADPAMKARAEETFKEAEEVFRQITAGHG